MSAIDKRITQLDLFAEVPVTVSQPEIIPEVTPHIVSAPAPLFYLHERRIVRESQDERRLTRKVLALLEL